MRSRLVPDRVLDVALALAVAAGAAAEIWVPLESRQGDGSPVASTVAALVMSVALMFRRTHPLPAATVAISSVVLVGVLAPIYVLFWGGFVPFCIAVYSVARYGHGRVPLLGGGIAAATMLVADLTEEVLQSPSEIVFHWTVLSLTWSAGLALQVKDRRAEESLRRAVTAEVTTAQQVLSAVVEERTRIARELHDIVAHAMSTMVVQAGAARQVVEEDPVYVGRALDTIRDTGAEALADMRRVVAMLRDAGEVGALSPQPGVAALPGLVEDASTGDLAVSLDIAGAPRELPAGLDLTVYRIVQEALTNVRRHANASRAEVSLRYLEDRLAVEVRDNGQGPRPPLAPEDAAPAGHGLVGMRERTALYGGQLQTGAHQGVGFVVRAELPMVAT